MNYERPLIPRMRLLLLQAYARKVRSWVRRDLHLHVVSTHFIPLDHTSPAYLEDTDGWRALRGWDHTQSGVYGQAFRVSSKIDRAGGDHGGILQAKTWTCRSPIDIIIVVADPSAAHSFGRPAGSLGAVWLSPTRSCGISFRLARSGENLKRYCS